VTTRFWFQFTGSAAELPIGLAMGCGVTASSMEAAIAIVSEAAFGGEAPRVAEVTEDVDVETLDPRHVLPNMGDPSRYGIWFPQGCTA